jgi:hypothetical protein
MCFDFSLSLDHLQIFFMCIMKQTDFQLIVNIKFYY